MEAEGPGCGSASFLQAEEDEFERLFTELLYASHSRAAAAAAAAAKMADTGAGSDNNRTRDERVERSEQIETPTPEVGMAGTPSPADCVRDPVVVRGSGPGDYGALRRRRRPQAPFQKSRSLQDGGASPSDGSKARFSDGAIGLSSNRGGKVWDTDDKLFLDLLDDLDNITGNTPSAKRRQKARDIFSDWLFSEQQVQADNEGQKKKNRKSFHEFYSHCEGDEDDGWRLSGRGGEGGSPVLDRRSRAGSLPSDGRRRAGLTTTSTNTGQCTPPDPQPLQPAPGTPGSPSTAPVTAPTKGVPLHTVNKPLAAKTAGSPSGSPESTLRPRDKKLGRRELIRQNTPENTQTIQSHIMTSDPNITPDRPTDSPPKITSPSADSADLVQIVNYRKKCPPAAHMLGEYSGDASGGLGDASRGLGVARFGSHGGGKRNIYQRWKLRGRPLSFEYLSEKIYSRDTVVYAKRPSLCGPDGSERGEDHDQDLFVEDPAARGEERPPLRPKEAWRTLKKAELDHAEAETSFNEQTPGQTDPEPVCLDTVSKFETEDDADSGYHTGESTLRGVGGAAPQPAPPPPGERTLTREDLKRRIDAFNDNQHGLVMKLREGGDTFQGFIRVYMNLMRPISMSLTARPPSIYDVLTPDSADSDSDSDTQTTSFYLPKDTTKVIHITSDTTAQEVIRALLQKFRITDNPRKFALYEKIEEQEQKYVQHKASRLRKKASMRRLCDDECPLALCLSWTSEGLNQHRFILQENDTGEIMWEAFSIPELDNFLRILDREEDEYVEQMKAKYHLLRIQITQHMKPLEAKQKQYKNDHRRPVFV